MKSFYTWGLALALGIWLGDGAQAQNPSLLPLPRVESSYLSPYGADAQAPQQVATLPGSNLVRRGYSFTNTPGENEPAPSPSDRIGAGARSLNDSPAPVPAESPAPEGAMVGEYGKGYADAGWGEGACNLPGCGCGPSWNVWVNGLYMARSTTSQRVLAWNDADPGWDQLKMGCGCHPYNGGFEVGIGYQLSNCARLEVLYWGLYPGDTSNSIWASDFTTPGNLVTTVDFNGLNFWDGNTDIPVNDCFDNVQSATVVRSYQVHNLEVNFWCGQWGCGPCCGNGTCANNSCGGMGGGLWGGKGCGDSCGNCGVCNKVWVNWTAGFRYFKFNDNFRYCVDSTGAGNDFEYDINTSNSLVGFQVGGRANYCLGNCLVLYAAPKVGIYNNYMGSRQWIFTSNGAITAAGDSSAYVDGNSALNAGSAYDLNSSRNGAAFLGSLDIGADYCINQCWKATVGYRAVFATGVALTENQIPTDFTDFDSINNVNGSGSLMLHGLYAGLEYNF